MRDSSRGRPPRHFPVANETPIYALQAEFLSGNPKDAG